jgi:Trk K+ transport system NAD-binding subunit
MPMYIIVGGGGQIGYYVTKGLLRAMKYYC